MTRADDGLGFILRYENVARYQDGEVIILDRRKYPALVEYVRCPDYTAVAQAIAAMVTQSGGPWLAAGLGMVSAARAAHGLAPDKASEVLAQAAYTLSHARPTTSARMAAHVQRVQAAALAAIQQGEDPEAAAYACLMDLLEKRYLQARKTGAFAVSLFPQTCTILTQCFAETLIGFVLLVAREQGKQIELICPETRPYLQGARLTASLACDMGVPVTVITDNMPAYVLSRGMAQVFISAADVICLDGHVVNKVGTYQIALAAQAHGVPYYVLGSPSPANPTIQSVEIELRDPQEVLHAMGAATTKPGVQGFYPAFDITPPRLVSAVVTGEGIYSPYDLVNHFAPRPPAED
jgi:methylthioribose-1-phosphate isomerase